LINFGVLPLTFDDAADWDEIVEGDVLKLPDICNTIRTGDEVEVVNET
ncbi:MAG: hypothetical protein GWN87_26895, partial [Desulfuromonadales bacterium]|nr:hypothetical protein [Desulfuromonadales bacterium]